MSSEAPRAELALAEVLDQVRATQGSITGILAEYQVDYGKKRMPSGSYLHRIVAIKAPSSLFHSNAHGHNRLAWRDDPFLWVCRVTRDDCTQERPNSAIFTRETLSQTSPLIGSLPQEWLFWATGIWPLTTRPAPRLFGTVSYMLPDYLADTGEKRLRPFQEEVAGSWCYVVDRPGIDTLWFDMNRGAGLVAREIFGKDSRNIMRRFVLEQQHEIGSGIWLPMRVRDIRFRNAEEMPDGADHSRSEVDFQIVRWQLNEDIPDALFEYVPRPGALWLNAPEGKPVQVDDRSEAHFDHVLSLSHRIVPKLRPPDNWETVPIILSAASALLLLCVYFVRNRSKMIAQSSSRIDR